VRVTVATHALASSPLRVTVATHAPVVTGYAHAEVAAGLDGGLPMASTQAAAAVPRPTNYLEELAET
jgi:hypothetical protein